MLRSSMMHRFSSTIINCSTRQNTRVCASKLSTSQRCFSSDDDGGDRLHSTDIAFKPAASGWGGGNKYNNNFDDIFGKNKKGAESEEIGDGKKVSTGNSPNESNE
mmetsp:Transcript_924/g.1199  ORF Transcript_924/g.1199 Transcript_924/m.1199 type:complete len:105 (+) Transcript_924:149-463(+)